MLSQFLRSLSRRAAGGRPARPARAALALEALEGREMPAVVAPQLLPGRSAGGAPLNPAGWAHESLETASAWRQGYTGRGVVVAVIDTGVDRDHPDLAGNVWANPREVPNNGRDDDGNGFVDDSFGWNFADGNNDTRDYSGHGTAVAGVVAARNNGQGSTGVAYDARIMPLRVFGSGGSSQQLTPALQARGYTNSPTANAIRYAVEQGAKVINLSLGTGVIVPVNGVPTFVSVPSPAIEASIRFAQDRGVFIAAAAGNDGRLTADYPARYSGTYSNVISVSSHNAAHAISGFSHQNNFAVGVSAPGESIYSTASRYNGNGTWSRTWEYSTGTSLSAPMVAGVAALMLSKDPGLSPATLRSYIYYGADQPLTGANPALQYPLKGARVTQALAWVPPVVPPSTGGTYAVRSGDTLWLIAQRQLGDGNRWQEIYNLNRDVIGPDPNALRVGAVLTLPVR